MENTTEVAFVTRKALVTFQRPIAVICNGTTLFTEAVIAEWDNNPVKTRDILYIDELRILSLPDGRKFDKSYTLKVNISSICALMLLDE